MSKKEVITKYNKAVAKYIKTEREQKYRKKEIAQLRREFESMPGIVDERPDEQILKH